jgi:hypothetical protein
MAKEGVNPMRPSSVFCCRVALSAILAGLLTQGMLDAQGNRASITGTVADPTGALVPGVNVAATNVGTGEVTRAVTNGDGIYSVLNLFPGKYSLRFEKAGFQPIDIPSITLESTQVAKLNEQLSVGATTQSVEVTTQAPILDTENATQGTHLSGQDPRC